MMPTFKHDCEQCVFLGTYDDCAGGCITPFDLYFCDGGSTVPSSTVLARYGDNGPDYLSGLLAVKDSPPLAAAKLLAEERGLISTDDDGVDEPTYIENKK